MAQSRRTTGPRKSQVGDNLEQSAAKSVSTVGSMSGKRVLAMKLVGMQGVNSVSECLVLLSTVCSSSPDSPASHRESRVQLSDLALMAEWQARESWLCKVKGCKGLTPLGLCSECRAC